MKANRLIKGVVIVLGLTGALALGAAWSGSNRIAAASQEALQVGRYQISAWATYSGARIHHSGYYVVDTVTGKIVDKGHEIHGSEGEGMQAQ